MYGYRNMRLECGFAGGMAAREKGYACILVAFPPKHRHKLGLDVKRCSITRHAYYSGPLRLYARNLMDNAGRHIIYCAADREIGWDEW